MQIDRMKLFKRAVCKLVDHDWDDTYHCKRCKKLKKYEMWTTEEIEKEGIPHHIVVEYLRRKYIDMLPPSQRLFLDE